MRLRLPVPRLMPFTIAALAAVLALKTVDLARYAAAARQGAAAVVAEARAAAPEKPPAAAADPATGNAAVPPEPLAVATPTPAAASAAAPSAAAASPAAGQPPPVTDGERAILLELRQRREQLDARDAAVAARESILAAAEQKLEAQAKALTTLQHQLQDLEAARRQRQEVGWQGLVKLYEDMKPRDAAVIFNDLEMPVLLPLVDRMKEQKAAAILAAMNPDKAREITAGLARSRTRREEAGTAAPAGG